MSRRMKIIMLIQLAILILIAPSVLSSYLPVSGIISYQLEWVWGEAVQSDDGRGWMVVNDLGYRVQVEQGYLVSYSTTLNECEHSHGILDGLFRLLAPAIAYAGHNSDGPDPAAITVSHVEALAVPESLAIGPVTVNEPGYCEGHYLVARADSSTIGYPDEVDMQGMSLYLRGTYTRPGAAESVPFIIETALAWGGIHQLMAPGTGDSDTVHAEISSEPVRITIRRRLDTMFNGLDFEYMSDDQRAKSVLRSLVDDTTFVVVSGRVHS